MCSKTFSFIFYTNVHLCLQLTASSWVNWCTDFIFVFLWAVKPAGCVTTRTETLIPWVVPSGSSPSHSLLFFQVICVLRGDIKLKASAWKKILLVQIAKYNRESSFSVQFPVIENVYKFILQNIGQHSQCQLD